jgi:RNA polymerase sigma-70 factor (sigma-E family)
MGTSDGAAAPIATREKATTRLRDLYVEVGPEAGRLAYLLVGDPEAAQDIAQEAFVRVGPRLRRLRDPEKARFYLRTTVINLCRAHWRRRERERSQKNVDPSTLVQADHSSRVEQHNEMLTALHKLSPRQRAAIVLRYYEDLTEHQTAEVLGCAIGTVKSSVSRALEILRIELGEGRHERA